MKGRCRRFLYAPVHHAPATRRQEKEEGNAIRTADRRGSAPRSPGLYFAESIRVLAAEYSSTCRKVRRRTPHGRARQCARRPLAGRRAPPRRQGLQNMIPYYAWNASAPHTIPRTQRPGKGKATRIVQKHMPDVTYRTFFSFRCFFNLILLRWLRIFNNFEPKKRCFELT